MINCVYSNVAGVILTCVRKSDLINREKHNLNRFFSARLVTTIRGTFEHRKTFEMLLNYK